MDTQGPVSWGLRFRLFSALAYWGWHSHQWAYPARAFTSDFWSREQSSTWGPPDVSVWWPFPFGWSVLPEERGPSVFFWGGGGRQWLKLGCQQRRGNVGLRLLVSRPLQSSAWDSRIQCLPGLPSPELTLSLCLANRMQGPHFLTHRLTNNPVFHLHPGLPLPDAPPFPPPTSGVCAASWLLVDFPTTGYYFSAFSDLLIHLPAFRPPKFVDISCLSCCS